MLQEKINCETNISVREAASNQSLSGGQGFLTCSGNLNVQAKDASVRKMENCAIILDPVIINDIFIF